VRKRRGGRATGTDYESRRATGRELKIRHYKSREGREKSGEETEWGKGIGEAGWTVEARQ
jgi:hypothetical protein